MEQIKAGLPLRLVPSRQQQTTGLVVFVVMLALALFWIAADSGVIEGGQEGYATYPGIEPSWREQYHPMLGLPFALLGLCGIVVSLVRMRPSSPLYHLQIAPTALIVRTMRQRQVFPWLELPELATDQLKWLSRSSRSFNMIHFVVARHAPAGEGGIRREAVLLRIPVAQYTAEDSEESARELAAWLNGLRERARTGTLKPGAEVDVPAAFRVVSMTGALPSSEPLTSTVSVAVPVAPCTSVV